jgi:hypothetical protein
MTLGSGVKEELQVLKSSESTRLGMLPSMMVVRTSTPASIYIKLMV